MNTKNYEKLTDINISTNNNNTNNENVNDLWETDSDDPYQYFRVKFDNNQKIKHEMKKILRLKSKKYKKIDSEAQEKLKKLNRYLNEEVFPTFGIKTNKFYSDEDDIDKLFLINNEYNINKKPELGSSLIFEINNHKNNLNLLGVSKDYFEAGTKIYKRSRLENYQEKNVKRMRTHDTTNFENDENGGKSKKKLKRIYKNTNTNNKLNSINRRLQLKKNLKLKLQNNESDAEINTINNNMQNNNIAQNNLNTNTFSKKEKKRKRRIKRYKKNSTIITITKIK